MHSSSMLNMQKAFDRYVLTYSWPNRNKINVIDIGGTNINGAYSDIFSDDLFNYKAVDIQEGNNVDIVLEDPYKFPFQNAEVDIIISGQAFEHIDFFWLTFNEMTRVLKEDGIIILIAPSSGPIHRFPVDNYRFYPDSYSALAKYSSVYLIDVWKSDFGAWNDLVGVFSKDKSRKKFDFLDHKIFLNLNSNKYQENIISSFNNKKNCNEDAELIKGKEYYLDILKKFHDRINPKVYLEIGVRNGDSFFLAKHYSIGVDPQYKITNELNEYQKLYKMTSDDYFDFLIENNFELNSIDFAFLDGMHLFENILRDFINVEKYSNEETIIVIDDIYPNHEIQAYRKRESNVWMGDVWKIVYCLKEFRPELEIELFDTSPSGLLAIKGLNKNNKVLSDNYNFIVRKYVELNIRDFYDEVIKRTNSKSPSYDNIDNFLKNNNMSKPKISIIIVNFNMDREIIRTVESFLPPYQLDIDENQIEIIVVDNGSKNIPIFPKNIKVLIVDEPNSSPSKAVNLGLKYAKGHIIGIVVDGARMASPGILKYVLACTKISKKPIITVMGFHIGPDLQGKSMLNGYCQEVEDKLLESIDWKNNGYKLFDISVFAGSNFNGWFGQVSESNALFMTKDMWTELNGFDERFTTLGGGFVNLDTYKRALALENSQNYILLGEGTFHQFHGGVTTNQPYEKVPFDKYEKEYFSIHNNNFEITETESIFVGSLPNKHKKLLLNNFRVENDVIENKTIYKKLFGKLRKNLNIL